MNKQKLLELASQLVFAGITKNEKEIEKVSEELAVELRQPQEKENGDGAYTPTPLEKDSCGFLKFNDKEISKMPKAFRHTFIAEGKVIFYRKRIRGKVSCSYEARYRRHGYNISVSATEITDLKQRFIQALHAAESGVKANAIPTNFDEFSMYYFETFRKRKVTAATYKSDLYRYNRYIKPYLQSIKIERITPSQCQAIIDRLADAGLNKTVGEIYSLLNVIFKMAIAHGIILRNPMSIVIYDIHESTHGSALTREEEIFLLKAAAGTPFQIMFAIALFTGLRPNEYPSAHVEGNFIVAINSKRKSKKVEYKRIPITSMLRKYIDGVDEFRFYVPQRIREKFRSILPNHKLYDLRTTFYTRCKECGVADAARDEFVGHSLGKLGNAYTKLTDEYLLLEGKKLENWYSAPEIAPINEEETDI